MAVTDLVGRRTCFHAIGGKKSNTSFKFRGAKFKGDVRGNYFTQSVESVYNVLPGLVVEADMKVTFKRLLDRHMDMKGMVGYGLHTQVDKRWPWHHVGHRHCGPKGLFLHCTVLLISLK